jgi:hypothetical protein
MRLKTFRLFENDMPEDMERMQDGGMYDKKTVYPELGPDTYYPDDFAAFVGAVHQWSMENKKPVLWSLSKDNGNQSKMYWDAYVKDEREMTLVEMGDKLIAVLHEGGNIIMAMDNMDKPVDLDMVKGKI